MRDREVFIEIISENPHYIALSASGCFLSVPAVLAVLLAASTLT